MRFTFIAAFLALSVQAFSQRTLFDSLKVDQTTKIIGRYPQYDKSKTYRKYNFILEDSVSIVEFIKSLKLGQEVRNSTEDPSFRLTIVKNFKEVGSWTINPTLGSAMAHDGHTYEFDLGQISGINKKHPFSYYHEIKDFTSKEEYARYLGEQKKRPDFLFDYSPQFKYEGSFEIEFPKNKQFPHPKAISDFLTPYIEKIVSEGEYSITYVLNAKNMNNMNQYTMTINGPEKLFKQLILDNLKTENWQPTVENAYFFYRN
jgi:hypothetical protein